MAFLFNISCNYAIIKIMLQTKQPLDFLEGTTDGGVEWRMLNMDSELIASSLTRTLGPGMHKLLSPHWAYGPRRGDGTVPLNHILRLETLGERCTLRTKLRQEYRLRLVTTRDEQGKLKRGHLVLNCELFNKDTNPQPLVGRTEFWLALTRLFAPPGKHRPDGIPAELAFLNEHELTENDLLGRDIELYRCQDAANGRIFHDTTTMVFHLDQSDLYQHIYTGVYMDQALDYLSLMYHKAGGDAGRLRFNEITIYFRKPFVPGQAAEVELDLVEQGNRFQGAVRFYHCNGEGGRSERISMAMTTQGALVGA